MNTAEDLAAKKRFVIPSLAQAKLQNILCYCVNVVIVIAPFRTVPENTFYESAFFALVI